MEISRDDLDAAVAQDVLTAPQADALWSALVERTAARAAAAPERDRLSPLVELPPIAPRDRFDAVHVAWYAGALIIIGAMGWFMTLGWERFGGLGILAIALVYAAGFALTGRALWRREALRIPGGLLITVAVCMTPIATYGLERWLGLWPASDAGMYRGFHQWIRGGWFAMEVATVVVGVVAVRAFRFPFLVAPIAFTLWYVAMDLAPLLYGDSPTTNERAWVSAGVGLAMLGAGYFVDRRTREDFAFWLYLFGLFAFWGGLSVMESSSELRKLLYCLVSVALMVVSIVLSRRAFMVFGALGVTGYLGYLAHDVFQDSVLFPFALSAIGVGVISLGIWFHRHRAGVERGIVGALPAGIRRRLPSERAIPSCR